MPGLEGLVICGYFPDLKTDMKDKGIEATFFEDGRDAFRDIPLIKNPRLFLVAFAMPYADGFELARFIRGHYPDVQIWFVTAMANEIQERIDREKLFDRAILSPTDWLVLSEEIGGIFN